MKITGQLLKENRERRGISLSEVALATKINIKVLIAMEEGDSEKLPTKTFLRGFVRSYARYLGLNEEEVLQAFYEEMGSTKPKLLTDEISPASPATPGTPDGGAPTEPKQGPARPPADPSQSSTASKVWAVTGIVLLVILIVVFKNKMDSYQSEERINELPNEIEAVDPNAQQTGPTTPSLDPRGSPSPSPEPSAAAAVATPTPSLSPTPAASPAASPTPPPILTPSPTATPAPSPSPSPRASPSPTPRASPSPSPTPTGRPQNVIIEALDDVEVEAQIDGEPPRRVRLRADQIHSFKAKRKISLRFTDGGAVSLSVNGADRGVPGDLGKPMRVDLP